MGDGIAITWWGHASTTVELGGVRIGTDPLLTDRLGYLRRHGPSPRREATRLDLVLVSHLHNDHLHAPSLNRVSDDATIVLPRGARRYARGLRDSRLVEVEPGDAVDVAGVRIDVLPARHDGRRHPYARRSAQAGGFRVDDGTSSFWYPGDTGLHDAMSAVDPVDLAVVPIGGWGPTLGPEHMDPVQAVEAVRRVGARWAVPVHYGTFWPIGMRWVSPANHRRLFTTPGPRFAAAIEAVDATAVIPDHGERVVLHAEVDQ